MKVRTKSGLEYEIIKKSDGPPVSTGQLVSVHYDMALSLKDLINENFIDSSHIRKQPIDFRIGKGEVLKGIDEGVRNMRVGELRRLFIPSKLAFGSKGVNKIIPPNTKLFVDIKLRYIITE